MTTNTLTNLIPDLYEAMDVVSREPVGFIPSVTLFPSSNRAALNQIIRVPITPAATLELLTPGQLPADSGDNTITNNTITISKAYGVPIRWSGEEEKGINTGPGYANVRIQQIAQAFRALTNQIEIDLGSLHTYASRAYGTAGTAPFATDLSDPAQLRKILTDNGAPLSDLQMVINTTAGAKVRSLAQLTKANEAGTTQLRELGKLLDIHGFTLRESAGVATFTAGTKTGVLSISGAAGATSLTAVLANVSGNAVALKKGDVITLAGDTNKYVVAADLTMANNTSSTLVIAAPGLLKTASSAALTISLASGVTASARNMAFSRNAIVLATRMPAAPEEGDMAVDSTEITDPVSGITFEIRLYRLYRRVKIEVGLAWGYSVVKPEHLAVMLG